MCGSSFWLCIGRLRLRLLLRRLCRPSSSSHLSHCSGAPSSTASRCSGRAEGARGSPLVPGACCYCDLHTGEVWLVAPLTALLVRVVSCRGAASCSIASCRVASRRVVDIPEIGALHPHTTLTYTTHVHTHTTHIHTTHVSTAYSHITHTHALASFYPLATASCSSSADPCSPLELHMSWGYPVLLSLYTHVFGTRASGRPCTVAENNGGRGWA